jgi:hypothetical protein
MFHFHSSSISTSLLNVLLVVVVVLASATPLSFLLLHTKIVTHATCTFLATCTVNHHSLLFIFAYFGIFN